jgi:beta-N-acetylhexosaminidase
VGLVVVAVAGTACRTAAPLDHRVAALEAELGQLLLVGFEGTEVTGNATIEALLCEARVGGVVLFARNIVDADQLARLTEALQERAQACTGRPLLVAVDAEGGAVMRLGPLAGYAVTLSAEDLGSANDYTLTELEARRIGARLREAGINWNLAPVIDIGYNPANPVIVGVGRSFSANPRLVVDHARAFIRGLHAEGLLTVLKHFPGHGSSFADSHRGFVDVTDTANLELELIPYRALIAEGLGDAVMTAHVVNRRLDPRHPATLSWAAVSGLLRAGLGFSGPVVSDDLRMEAIAERYSLGAAAVLALQAGVDVLLVSNDRLPDGRSATPVVLEALQSALVEGQLDPDRVATALGRVRALKARIPPRILGGGAQRAPSMSRVPTMGTVSGPSSVAGGSAPGRPSSSRRSSAACSS